VPLCGPCTLRHLSQIIHVIHSCLTYTSTSFFRKKGKYPPTGSQPPRLLIVFWSACSFIHLLLLARSTFYFLAIYWFFSCCISSQALLRIATALRGTSSAAQKAKRRTHARPELTDEQKQEIKEAFKLFVTDKDGCVDYYHELRVAMRVLGFDLKKAEVPKLLWGHDKDNTKLMAYRISWKSVSTCKICLIFWHA
jgi:hypothetical protein